MQLTGLKRRRVLLSAGLGLGALGLALWLAGGDKRAEGPSRKVVCYQDSMHPWVKSDQPGKCTICAMDLTPIYEGQQGFGDNSDLVLLSSNSVTVLNVQTEEVARRPLRCAVRVAGTLDADETHKAVFSAPAAGRIEEMAVESVGDEVEVEQRLFTFYSPELATWRRAYVIRNRSATLTTPFFAGRPSGGAELEGRPKPGPARHVTGQLAPASDSSETDPYFSDLLSPLSGTVVERKVFNGQYVAEGDRLLTIVDTSVLWFRFDVYEQQLPWLKRGQKVRVTVPAVPGREFSAVVSVIEPAIDETTRTVKVRADIANPVVAGSTRKLRPLRLGMYADGWVEAEMPPALTVPDTAVLFRGGQAYAYVEEGPGAYAMRTVKLGRQGDKRWEVVGGLDEGERVVTAGNVLIDAQAQFVQPNRSNPADSDEEDGRLAMQMPPVGDTPSETETMPHGEMPAVEHDMQGQGHELSNPIEVSGSQAPVETRPPTQAASAPAPVRRNPSSGTSMGTANTRHPEARERMARSFATGLAERHRAAAGFSLVSSAAAAELPQAQQETAEARAMHQMHASAAEGLAARGGSQGASTAPISQAADGAGLNAEQRKACAQFLAVADGVSQALAADDLGRVNQQLHPLATALRSVVQQFGESHPWHENVEQLATASRWAEAKNLDQARESFLPFSTQAVALAKLLKKASPEFATLKIYHCPMAPKPGLWLQAKGPLRNPYYGAKMLSCGEEVKK